MDCAKQVPVLDAMRLGRRGRARDRDAHIAERRAALSGFLRPNPARFDKRAWRSAVAVSVSVERCFSWQASNQLDLLNIPLRSIYRLSARLMPDVRDQRPSFEPSET